MSRQSYTQTVFIVDDNPAVRDSLSLLLESVDLHTASYASAGAFLDDFDPQAAGCLILDIRMPGMSGMDLAEQLRERQAILPVIFITGHGDVPMAVEAMKLGALDFIQKPFRDQVMLDCVYRALAHDAAQRRSLLEVDAIRERLGQLTPRERQVLDLIMDGKANRVIAEAMNLSPRTVELHRARLMEKMNAGSLAVLAQMVTRARL